MTFLGIQICMRILDAVREESSLSHFTCLWKALPTPFVGLGTTFSSPENQAMFWEILTNQLPLSQTGKCSAFRNVDFNCPSLLKRSTCTFQFLSY